MKKLYFLTISICFINIVLCQGKLQKNQEFLYLYGTNGKTPIGIFEVVRDKLPNVYNQYLLRDSDSNIVLIINKKYTDLDSLKNANNPTGSLYYLEFLFIDNLFQAQVPCSRESRNDLKFVKDIVSKLCEISSGCGHCPSGYRLNYTAVKEFIKQYTFKY